MTLARLVGHDHADVVVLVAVTCRQLVISLTRVLRLLVKPGDEVLLRPARVPRPRCARSVHRVVLGLAHPSLIVLALAFALQALVAGHRTSRVLDGALHTLTGRRDLFTHRVGRCCAGTRQRPVGHGRVAHVVQIDGVVARLPPAALRVLPLAFPLEPFVAGHRADAILDRALHAFADCGRFLANAAAAAAAEGGAFTIAHGSATHTVCFIKNVVVCLPRPAFRVLPLTFPLEAFVARERAHTVLGGAFHSLSQRRGFF